MAEAGAADPVAAVTVRAPSKLTLSLRITGVRPDGFHLLEAEMVTLQLADELHFSAGDALTVGGPHAAGIPTDDTNLVRRALQAAGRTASVHVDKLVPSGGGLGGGSADAAAVLRWAGVDDLDLAVRIGADVPFCLVGGRAMVRGIGEQIEPLAPAARTFTLIVPPLHVSTPAAYRAWDELGGPADASGNDLEPAALAVEPALALWRDRITSAAGRRPTLAGSGATWFLEGDHAHIATALPDAQVAVTRTDRP